MKITCPSCHFSAEVDAARIPKEGTTARCPKCQGSFVVTTDVASAPGDSPTITSPKCGRDQQDGPSCVYCGVIYDKIRDHQEQPPSAAQPVDESIRAVMTPSAAEKGPFRFGHGRREILAWAETGQLRTQDLPRAFQIAGTLPGQSEWRRFLDGFALWLGSLFLAAAVIFFFAYNWQDLGHYARFGLVELLLITAVLASWRLDLERMAGKAALLVATLLVGALLALVGQTYQTGADPWELFACWALFVLPWVAISRFAPLWVFWLALINLAVSLYYHAFAGFLGILLGTETLWWLLAGVNTLALAVWEVAAWRRVPWLTDRWAPRLLATASAGYVTLLACWGIVEMTSSGGSGLFGLLVWLGGVYAWYRRASRDLYVLALGVLSIIIVTAVFLGHHLVRHGDPGAFLMVGMVVLGLSAAGGWWLRQVAREEEA